MTAAPNDPIPSTGDELTEAPDLSLDATETDTAEPEKTSADSEADSSSASEEKERPRSKANREAARYRTQLREAEARALALDEQIKALHSEIINVKIESERIGGEHLRHPDDLFIFTKTEAKDYFDDSGTFNAGKLTEAVAQLHEQRPELFWREPEPPRPSPYVGGSDMPFNATLGRWGDLIGQEATRTNGDGLR